MSTVSSRSDPSADTADTTRQQLSALVDGELDAASVTAACAAWKDDAESRAAWHSYQLIGDVLRSDDLASRSTHDSVFMTGLRARLAAEPVVLAPESALSAASAPSNSARGRRWAWAASSAVAAGFVVVAGGLLLAREPVSVAPNLASVAAPAIALAVADTPARAPSTSLPVSNGRTVEASNVTVIRDPQLDRYLAAHKQFAGNSALGMPSGFLRNVATEVPGR